MATDWLTVTPVTGGSGTTNVNVKASENSTDVSRKAVIIITAGNISKRIKVTQQGKGTYDYNVVIKPNSHTFEATGSCVFTASTMGFTSAATYTWILDGASSYAIISGTSGASSCTVVYQTTVDNDTTCNLKCTVKEGNTTKEDTITITLRKIWGTHFLQVDPTSFKWDYNSSSYSSLLISGTSNNGATYKIGTDTIAITYFDIETKTTSSSGNKEEICSVKPKNVSQYTDEYNGIIYIKSYYNDKEICSGVSITRNAKPNLILKADRQTWGSGETEKAYCRVYTNVNNMEVSWISGETSDFTIENKISAGIVIPKGEDNAITAFTISPKNTGITEKKTCTMRIGGILNSQIYTASIEFIQNSIQITDITIGHCMDGTSGQHSLEWEWDETGTTEASNASFTEITGQTTTKGYIGYCNTYGSINGGAYILWDGNQYADLCLTGTNWYQNVQKKKGGSGDGVGKFYPNGYNIYLNSDGKETDSKITVIVTGLGITSNEVELIQRCPEEGEYELTGQTITYYNGNKTSPYIVLEWDKAATINKYDKDSAPYIEYSNENEFYEVFDVNTGATGITITQKPEKYNYNTLSAFTYNVTGTSYEISGKTSASSDIPRSHSALTTVTQNKYDGAYLIYNLGNTKDYDVGTYTSLYNTGITNGYTEKEEGQKGSDERLNVAMRDYIYNNETQKQLAIKIKYPNDGGDNPEYTGATYFDWNSDEGRYYSDYIRFGKYENNVWKVVENLSEISGKTFTPYKYYQKVDITTGSFINDITSAELDYLQISAMCFTGKASSTLTSLTIEDTDIMIDNLLGSKNMYFKGPANKTYIITYKDPMSCVGTCIKTPDTSVTISNYETGVTTWQYVDTNQIPTGDTPNVLEVTFTRQDKVSDTGRTRVFTDTSATTEGTIYFSTEDWCFYMTDGHSDIVSNGMSYEHFKHIPSDIDDHWCSFNAIFDDESGNTVNAVITAITQISNIQYVISDFNAQYTYEGKTYILNKKPNITGGYLEKIDGDVEITNNGYQWIV